MELSTLNLYPSIMWCYALTRCPWRGVLVSRAAVYYVGFERPDAAHARTLLTKPDR